MFLELLRRRNPRFVQTVVALHQQGRLPPNTVVIDLDTVEDNARIFAAEAHRHGPVHASTGEGTEQAI